MAILNLTKVWLNRIDTGEAISAQSGTDRPMSKEITGDVRPYAGGRQRSFSQIGTAGQWQVTLRDVTLSTVEELEDWMGQTVQVRDHRGQIFHGVFFAVPRREHKGAPTLYDVTLTFRLVTVPEGV